MTSSYEYLNDFEELFKNINIVFRVIEFHIYIVFRKKFYLMLYYKVYFYI